MELWLETRGSVCPITGRPMTKEDLAPDVKLRNEIVRYHIERTMAAENEAPFDLVKESDAADRFRKEVEACLSNKFRRLDNTIHILKQNPQVGDVSDQLLLRAILQCHLPFEVHRRRRRSFLLKLPLLLHCLGIRSLLEVNHC